MRKTHTFFFACLFTFAMSSGSAAEWQHTNGLNGEWVNALEVNGTYLFAGTRDSGVFRSGDSGASWLAVNAGLTNPDIRALVKRGIYLFAGTYGGGVFRSGDSAASWQTMNTGISTLNIQALGGNDSFLFAGTSGGGVCRSSDDGMHWLEVSNGLVHVNVFSIGVSSMYVFVGTWGGSAFRSADNGLNWFLVTNGLFDPRENIIPYCFAVADTFIFAGTGGGGVFRAKDSARVWYPFNTGLPAAASVTALALSDDTLFAATQSGVFRSVDNGDDANWVPDNNGLADTIVLSFAASGSTLFAGTNGGGVWRRALSEPTIPLAPVLSSPGNGASGIAVNPALSWSASRRATSYSVQVSAASDFLTPDVNQSGLISTSYNVSGLLNNTTYYWQVNASNAGGTSAWTLPRSFTTIMASASIPIAILPDSGALDVPVALPVSWRSAQNASSYRIQLSTASSFAPLLLDSGNVHDTLLALTELSNSTLYFWRVSAVNAAGQSSWSRGMSFTTICELPAQVVALPDVNDTLTIDSVLCTWNEANPLVTKYQLRVYSDSLLTVSAISDSTIADTAFMLRDLSNDQTYWWRVRACNVAGWGPFSNICRIIVRIPTPPPALLSIPVTILPDSGALDVPVALPVSWRSAQNASSYRIQLSTASSFTPLLLDSGNVHDTLLSLSALSNSTLYFWRVSAVNAADQSVWSRSMSFTTICELPAQVVALTDVNDTLTIDSVLCTWNEANPLVTKYQLRVYSDSLLTVSAISDSTIADTAFMLRDLSNDQTYWWRVRAYNIAGWGPFSSVYRIIVRIPTTAVLPSSFTVAFSGVSLKNGRIRYGIPTQCLVSLVAYDVKGGAIRNYVSSQQSPGYYNVNLNLTPIAAGQYFLRFVAGEYDRIIPFFIH